MKNLKTYWIYSIVMIWVITLFNTAGASAQTCCGACTVPGNNLITNGNFSLGNNGSFSSGHHFVAGGFGASGDWGIYTNPTTANGGWQNCTDHTGGGGNMMVIDGSLTANTVVWQSTVNVQPNTNYSFVFFAANVNGPNPPNLSVQFNGTTTGAALNLAGAGTCNWVSQCINWNSGANNTVTIRIFNSVIVQSGNDFALDDISFTACTPIVTANAGPDTIICAKSCIALPVPTKGSWHYTAINGDLNSAHLSGNIVCPDTTTTYVLSVIDDSSCCKAFDTVVVNTQDCCPACTVPGNNLITNGDFSGGNTGFQSGHTFMPGTFTTWGEYGIQTSPSLCNSNWAVCGDHTTGTGNMMVVDGSDVANTDVWRTSAPIAVLPNTKYYFKFFAASANTTSPAQLFVQFNGTTVGGTLSLTGVANCVWTPLTVVWNSGANATVSIRIRNTNTASGGNDFAIDDISFIGCVPIVTANAGNDTTVCKESCISLPIPSNGTWSYKVLSGDNSIGSLTGNNACPDTTTTYVLTVIDDATNCKAYDTVKVVVTNCCSCHNTCFTPGPNKISNGDFSGGFTGFSTDYNLNTGPLTSPKDYAVLGTVNGFNSNTWLGNGNPGKFMYVDGSMTTSDRALYKTVTGITKGATYTFCLDLNNLMDGNLHLGYALPDVEIRINGVVLGHEILQELPDQWLTFTYPWTADGSTALIEIRDLVGIHDGSDFGIDNISLRQCKPSAGPDTTICNDMCYTLPIPDDPTLVWTYKVLSGDMSSLSNGNTACPGVTTKYILTVVNPATGCSLVDTVTVVSKPCCPCPNSCYIPGPDLIVNGDFEAGNTGFTSQYIFTGAGQGHYFVDTSSAIVGLGNKFGDPHNFLFADGATTANKFVWRESVPVNKNTVYTLCFNYIDLTINDPNHPQINARINGVSLVTVVPTSTDPWGFATVTWNSGSATVANIEFYDNSIVAAGNDFGLDNISFRGCTPKISVDAGPDTTICLGSSVTLPAGPPAPLQWSYQVLNDGLPYSITTNVVSPTHTTIYVLSVSDPATQCEFFDTVVVHVVCCYCVQGGNPTNNLITNGDFSSGATGFSTMYTPGGPTSGSPGNYWVQTLSSPVNANWDKTGDPGKFLFVDGATSAGYYMWRQTVSVAPNTNHTLCLEAVNLNKLPGFPTPNDPVAAVYINGSLVVSKTIDETFGWTPLTATWNSGVNTSAVIEIYTLNTLTVGNDMGIDNISFVPCDNPPMPGRPEPTGSGNTSTNNPAAENGAINIYPNPASTELNIQVSESVTEADKVVITDLNGRIVYTAKVDLRSKREFALPLSGLPKGMYGIALYNGTASVHKKLFMKQ